MNIGIGVKTVRRSQKFNQKQFAEKVGITQSYLSLIESNKKTPSTEVLQQIAEAVEVSLPVLFWFMLDENDVDNKKLEMFRLLKPSIDKLITDLFN
jgi:transcriptional regulator with XRE-family HTH domain